jgi:DNA polymerase
VATPWRTDDDEIVYKDTLFFKGTDSVTRQWCTQTTYSGKLVENAAQAVARDVMAQALIGLDAWGYETVLTVHDEIVAESTERVGTAEHFSELMTVLPDWADGLPLVAEGFEDRRYRK